MPRGDNQPGELWVEPIWRHLPIAPSIYGDHLAKRDGTLCPDMQRFFEASFQVYGRAECLAQDAPGRVRRGLMQPREAGEGHGPRRRHSRQEDQDHASRQDVAVPAGQGEPTVPRAGAGHALGERFHLCRDLARLRLRCLCHRCLRAPLSSYQPAFGKSPGRFNYPFSWVARAAFSRSGLNNAKCRKAVQGVTASMLGRSTPSVCR